MTVQGTDGPDTASPGLRGYDPTVPSPARVWNYFAGGKDHFAADRALAGQMVEVAPEVPVVARLTRQFIRRAVEELVTVYGIRQFLDIGSGLPTAENTHEVAQWAAPGSRVVYVDNDPVVIRHAEALLDSTPEGAPSTHQARCIPGMTNRLRSRSCPICNGCMSGVTSTVMLSPRG